MFLLEGGGAVLEDPLTVPPSPRGPVLTGAPCPICLREQLPSAKWLLYRAHVLALKKECMG